MRKRKSPPDPAKRGAARERKGLGVLEDLLAEPPSEALLEEAYRIWLRKFTTASEPE